MGNGFLIAGKIKMRELKIGFGNVFGVISGI
jgi:hypothetical protein